MALASKLEVLKQNEIDEIHDATIKILEETGIIFQSEEALKYFKEHGAKVDGQTVYIPKDIVEKCLQTAPESFTWWARNSGHMVTIGGQQKQTVITPNAGTINVQDIDNGRRANKMEDFINIAKLCQASDIVNAVGMTSISNPVDVDPEEEYIHKFYQLLKNTDKPIVSDVYENQKKYTHLFDMFELAVGKEGFLLEHPSIAVSVNSSSPLCFGSEQLETLITFARKKQPVFILPCALAGVSAPISLLGTMILQNAEILSGIVLTQLVNPGTPVVYSPASTVANMKKASYIGGSPEANLINMACIQIALNLYHIPTRSMGGITDAKVVDYQAGYETMQNLFMLISAGVHIVNESLGCLDSIMTTSYEKFIIDQEIISRIMRIMEGIDVANINETVDLIQDVSHLDTYITHPDTFSNFRKRWQPTVACWDSYEEWENQGAEDILMRANKIYKEILNESKDSLINLELDKELRLYMEKIKNSC